MSTEVLLMSDVNDLGAEGDIVKVADGYARNFLLPKKLAAPVTEEPNHVESFQRRWNQLPDNGAYCFVRLHRSTVL